MQGGGIASGLGSALCFGVGDFFAQDVTHRNGWRRSMLWLQIFSVPMLIGAAFIFDGAPRGSLNLWWLALGLGLTNTVGALGLYRSFEVGSLSVVSPIASTFAAVTVIWSWVFGMAPPLGVILGLGVTLVGVACASIGRGDALGEGPTDPDPTAAAEAETGAEVKKRAGMGAGVGAALVAAVGFGTTFFGVELVVDEMGPIWPVFAFRLVGIPILLTLSVWARKGDASTLLLEGRWPRAVGVAALDTAGLCIYGWGLTQGNVAVVAVLSSLFAVVTVFLAQLRLGERLAWWQWLGLVCIFSGVAAVTFLGAG